MEELLILSFDHLVHFVHDPKQAIDRLGKAGFYAVEGGRQRAWNSSWSDAGLTG
jgi:hypothetical protein